ncbi:MAG: hypothetical protein RBU25_19735 [Lentisphaeria bacterium]|jgi:cephalosporin-C deacetylase-like acetyl esterase|nr:hypothetical protein [Lentisphaeria bacterium]
MRLIAQQVEQLQKLDVPSDKEADFDEFWSKTDATAMEVYPFGGHEMRGFHVEKELAWLRSHFR